MALSIAAAGQNVISSLYAFKGAIESENAAGAGADVGSAQGVDDADPTAQAASGCDDAQEEDPRQGMETTQSQELQEMLQLMKAFMDAIMSMNQQPSQDDDGFSPVSSPSGGRAGGQANAGMPDLGGGAPQGPVGAPGAGAAPTADAGPAAGGAAPAAGEGAGPAAGARGPAASASSTGAGPLSTSAQTAANTPEQTAQIASQWKDNLKKDFGLTDDQARGVVGSLMHESGGMNSGITQGGRIGEPNGNMADDNANGFGIAQWGGVRKQGLIDFAQKSGIPASSQAANYGFLKQELSGPYADAINAVKGTGDVASATAAFTNTFEKPSDPQMASRIAYAEQVA